MSMYIGMRPESNRTAAVTSRGLFPVRPAMKGLPCPERERERERERGEREGGGGGGGRERERGGGGEE